MRPETRFQKDIMDAILEIISETGRAATLTEVAQKTGKSLATVHKHAKNLRAQGLLQAGRKLQPDNNRYAKGWRDGVHHLGKEVARILVEHHASETIVSVVDDAIQGAIGAAL